MVVFVIVAAAVVVVVVVVVVQVLVALALSTSSTSPTTAAAAALAFAHLGLIRGVQTHKGTWVHPGLGVCSSFRSAYLDLVHMGSRPTC